MERYTLGHLYDIVGLTGFTSTVKTGLSLKYSTLLMGLTATQYNDIVTFICGAIWGYYYDDLVSYQGEDESAVEVQLNNRLVYDIAVKLPYWYKKYNYIKKLLTTEDLSLLQTSKMTSSSTDATKTAGGSLQKIATTPTGVSADSSTDEIDITIGSGSDEGENTIDTTGFVDKYTNTQQKYANASKIEGERSGEILREGSIDDLLKILEKLPSSFANEVCKEVQKHFIFDYDGEEQGIYEIA